MLADLIEMAANTGMVIGPCIGFIIQIQKMTSNQSAEGFSSYVSLILIVSNIIRVFWWQAARFSTVILCAAILMIACQFVLLYTSVKFAVKTKQSKPQDSKNIITLMQQFWQWDSFGPYIKTISLITTFFAGVTMLFGKYEMYAMVLGTLSSGVEAVIGTPQFKLNFQRKNTQGLSIVLIGMWLFGDVYKLSYYSAQAAPIQLFACAGFQVLMDMAILSQFWIYREENARKEAEVTCKNRTDFTIIEGQNSKEARKVSDAEQLDTASSVSRSTITPCRNDVE